MMRVNLQVSFAQVSWQNRRMERVNFQVSFAHGLLPRIADAAAAATVVSIEIGVGVAAAADAAVGEVADGVLLLLPPSLDAQQIHCQDA